MTAWRKVQGKAEALEHVDGLHSSWQYQLIGRASCLVDGNKTDLFKLFAESVKSVDVPGKELYSTYGEKVVTTETRESMEGLQPCSHEEDNTRIFLHVLDAATQHSRIIAFGTRKQFKY